ncbi:MAG: TspO/MBR family protein [Pseudomonadota bacterium]
MSSSPQPSSDRAAGVRPFLVAGAAALSVSFAGGSLTTIGPWYRALEKSTLNPPDWVFGPVWTIIYILVVFSAVYGWRTAQTPSRRRWVTVLFLANAGLNVGWSALFFAMQRPDWALMELTLLWLSVAALIAFLAPFARVSALLLTPYLAWVSFAGYLNMEVVRLNPPFAGGLGGLG